MKKILAGFLFFAWIITLAGCSGGGKVKSPAGDFALGSVTFTLGKNGSFHYVHTASSEDKKNYTINGRYTYTYGHWDEDNEISWGKIDLTISELILEKKKVQSLDFIQYKSGTDVAVGQKLLGWWKFMNLITYGGKMQIGLNLQSTGYRPEDVNTGRDWLFKGDPG